MTRLLLALAAVSLPAVAFAQTQPQTHDRRVPVRTQYIDFGNEVIDVNPDTPTMSYNVVKGPAHFENRIPLRMNFDPELQRSNDNVRGP